MTLDPPTPHRAHAATKRAWIFVAVWVVLFLIALSLDRAIASAVRGGRIDVAIRGHWLAELVKAPGTFWFTAAVAVAGVLLRRLTPAQSLFIALAGITSGINGLVKWLVGRTRPFKLPGNAELQPFHLEPFWHGINGLFHQKDLCFPSGHACTAFALASAVVMVRPRWGWFFIPLAILVGVERFVENAHYLSDVIGALGVGAGGTLMVHAILRRRFDMRLETSAFPVALPPRQSQPATIQP